MAEAMHELLVEYRAKGLSFAAWVVMPNHLHLLTNSMRCADSRAFFQAWQKFKQTTALILNRELQHRGRFWQPDWYDRWIRDPGEYQRWLEYLRKNPVSAGLVLEGGQYPFMRIRDPVA